ncbi:hypothetical protein AWB76_07685 [Caballeronia temeraria]|uniref:Uncharacterized protein n=1 Tax=Caballeronia temeraria TaxID=1777137 RepID=A0A158DZZ0_9BURK|nr:hypothetical protein AWB76_07685 [Caballeronia temeraria]
MVHKVTATQEVLKPPAPIGKRQSRIWLLQDRFNGKSYVGDIGVDHAELEGPQEVSVTGVHASITAWMRDC